MQKQNKEENDFLFTYGIFRDRTNSIKNKEGILKGYQKIHRTHSSIKPNKNSFVIGSILTVTPKNLKMYDYIEGVQEDYYHRFKAKATLPDGSTLPVWVYQQSVDKEE